MSGWSEVATADLACLPDLADAHWFPVDMHVPRREYGFLSIAPAVLEHSTFLDTRIEAPLDDAVVVSVDMAAQTEMPVAKLAWLFHTSFCCSTLLARVLHLPPHQVVLKEPLVLRRLGDARYARWPIEELMAPTVRLLARPWDPGGAVVVKPTHAALNVAADLLAATPDSRGVILTSSLDDFLVSNLKKTEETQAKVPGLAERALQAGTLHARLPPGALAPPDLLAAAALQWAAQRELCVDIMAAARPQQLRVVDASALLDDVPAVAWQCAQWLRLPVPREALANRAVEVSRRNAKAIEAEYDPHRRAADVRLIQARCGHQIDAAKRWFVKMVLPAMRPEALNVSEIPCHDH